MSINYDINLRVQELILCIQKDFTKEKYNEFWGKCAETEQKHLSILKSISNEGQEANILPDELIEVEKKITYIKRDVSELKMILSEDKFRIIEMKIRKLNSTLDSIYLESESFESKIKEDINQLNYCSDTLKTILVKVLSENVTNIKLITRFNNWYESELSIKIHKQLNNTRAATIGSLDDLRYELNELIQKIN